MRKSISLLLALLGLFDSLYLLWEYMQPSRTMVCFGTGSGCDAVRASVYAHIWGFPMPVFGVAGYVLIAVLIIAESLAPASLANEVRYTLVGATGFGFLFSLYLEYLQKFVIHHFCMWCVTSGVVMTALCALAIYNVARPAIEADVEARTAQLRSYIVVGIIAVLVGTPAFYALTTHGEKPPPPPPSVVGNTADRLVRPDSHVTGNSNAPVTVVEFGDFECPACGAEEPVAKQIRAKYGKQIRFVFRQFPLGHIHVYSEKAAQASECAAEQGKFYEAVDQLYSHQDDLSEPGLKRIAGGLGLDMGKFNQCLASGAEAARVKRDHDDGKALGVAETPTIFIDGHPAPGIPDFNEFSQLIDQALRAKGVSASAASAATTAAATGAGAAGSANSAAPPESKNTAKPASASPQPAPAEAATEPASSGFGLLGSGQGGALSSFGGEVACSEDEAAKKQPTLINTSQLKQLLAGNSKPLFVDVRSEKDYTAGKIPGAINIPVNEISKRLDALPKDRVIVFYESGKSSGDICAAGRAAGRILLEHGYPFDHVKVYQDGLAGWEKSGLQSGK